MYSNKQTDGHTLMHNVSYYAVCPCPDTNTKWKTKLYCLL